MIDFHKSLGNLKYDFRNRNLYPLVLSYAQKKTLLDIGCGAGHLLHHARQKGLETLGVESDKDFVALSKSLYGNLNIRHMPAEDLDQIHEKFDNVTLIDVLEHIKDDVDVLRKIKGLLSVKGKLIIVVPHHPHLYGKRDVSSGHYRRYGRRELVAKLEKAGFSVEVTRHWNMLGYWPYFWFEKVLRREVNVSIRTGSGMNPMKKILNAVLNAWVKYIERNVNFGFGLSLICVAWPKAYKI